MLKNKNKRVFYVDVGDMSYEQMTAYIDSVKSKFEKSLKKMTTKDMTRVLLAAE